MWLVLLWVLLLLDSSVAVAATWAGGIRHWAALSFPCMAELFPLDTAWPYLYLSLALLGLATVSRKQWPAQPSTLRASRRAGCAGWPRAQT